MSCGCTFRYARGVQCKRDAGATDRCDEHEALRLRQRAVARLAHGRSIAEVASATGLDHAEVIELHDRVTHGWR